MTAAAPPLVPPPVHEHGMNGPVPGHAVNMSLPRFHPIAMNPNQPVPPEHAMHHHYYRPFPPPPQMQEPGPPNPPAHPPSIDHIEARLRQLEQEEAARMAARSQLLAIRKREDEEFRRMTEHAEAEEEPSAFERWTLSLPLIMAAYFPVQELRRQRKRLKRESMGLGYNATIDSPPLRPTPPRRLSETNAATTLAFFKQQSPPEPRPIQQPPPQPAVQAPPPSHPQPQHIQHDHSTANSIRRKQKYTIKNVEAWGERHGRPAAHDPSGRALWKRPSDGSLVYLTCPVHGCGKADFVTLHGFMCHLTKKHKDRSLGSQSRALEVCGVVFDPNAPLPPVLTVNRASTEESRMESANDMEYSSTSDDEGRENLYPVKCEPTERPLPAPAASLPTPEEMTTVPRMNGSAKQTISSIIDRDPTAEPRVSLKRGAPESAESALRASGQRRGSSPERAEIPAPRDFKMERMDFKETAEA
ncbi:uncharacterized protein ACLA_069010 [Aspergillus clavatus NRRL 1]|uniref:Uncharacterized protein n=1 Tax=Aspergillus clavatus (strain ATCC 1007 / CBS 513.65 / DSM 816 / NCTC 3887 / NRRL 1 / QM 1276 / 107) TaxID=344612 RepID=A1C652_ASPCL|nr:uncharacterized protein ACLA_069010 [Aspergillus clavatus NRRL 1]EAW13873.1 conserved hypothetical protein [Aspergillus clavatus NRRL 1]